MDVWKQGLGCHNDSSNIQNERKSRHVCILKTIGKPMPSQFKKTTNKCTKIEQALTDRKGLTIGKVLAEDNILLCKISAEEIR